MNESERNIHSVESFLVTAQESKESWRAFTRLTTGVDVDRLVQERDDLKAEVEAYRGELASQDAEIALLRGLLVIALDGPASETTKAGW